MTEARIPASLKLPKQQHASGYLLVAISDLELRDAGQSAKPHIRKRAGDVAWMPAGAAEWKNPGKTPAWFLTLEFK